MCYGLPHTAMFAVWPFDYYGYYLVNLLMVGYTIQVVC